jgi:tubulin beta
MQAGQCDNQTGIKFWEVVSDEHGIGGGGEYCGDNDAQFGRMYFFYHGASQTSSPA